MKTKILILALLFVSIFGKAQTITLSSAVGTDNQTVCVNTPIVNIQYTTTGVTGATVSGLPTGINGVWLSNTVTISGTSTISGTFPYTVTTTGGAGSVTASGTITVAPYPNANTPPDMEVVQAVFTGTAIFDLTSQLPIILAGQTGFNVLFYNSQADALAGTNTLLNTTAHTNTTNPQRIWYKVQNPTTGCMTVSSFLLKVTNPNVVYIPDNNFKAKLIALGVDTNGDSGIQFSEALVPTGLDVSSSNIYDLTGIESFTNITYLDCTANHLTSLNVINLINLNYLYFDNNQISVIDLNNLISLQELNCMNNQLTSLNVNNLLNLRRLDCSYNHLSTLSISDLINLQFLYCQNNQLNTLYLNNLPILQFFNCSNNQLISLDVSGLQFLDILDCHNNLLNSLNLNILGGIRLLYSQNNQLQTLNVNSLVTLQELNCSNNQISFLNTSNLPNLLVLHCSNNQLQSLILNNNETLKSLRCNNNLLSTIYMKNGSDENFHHNIIGYEMSFSGNPNLQYICSDDFQITDVQNLITSYGYTNCQVSSYCSFTPGGPYNTITGTTRFDANGNGCDNTDPIFKNLRVDINDGTNTGATYSNNLGVYNFFVQQPNLTLTPQLENPSYFTVSPATATVNFPSNNFSTTTQDFCISANGVHNDLEVVLSPIGGARPGFDAHYQVVYKNKGNQTLSGILTVAFDDAHTDFVSATPTISAQAVNSLTWNYANLLPFEVRVIDFYVNLNTPLETPPLNNGDFLDFSATIDPRIGDEISADNVFNFHQTVVNSYDPNDKTCMEGNVVSPDEIGKYLHYNINFENTGTAAAVNVVVKDVIDSSMFDISSLQVLHSSTDVKAEIKGNNVEFIFQNINLAPRPSGGGPGGHGNVLFKIKTKPTLTAGSQVANTANIYFDYNAPINTNEARTTFQSLATTEFEIDNSVSVYPNPTQSIFNVKCNNNIKMIKLFDIQGRILETILADKNESKVDISNQANGVYFVKINTENGVKVEKIVKE